MPKRSVMVNVAVAAVALAVGGVTTAGAAKLLTGKDIKDGSIEVKDLSKKARAALAGKAGPRGLAGTAGAAGAAGATGAAGAPGQTGTGGKDATGQTMGGAFSQNSGTFYAQLGGGTFYGNSLGARAITPNKALTISGMSARAVGLAGGDTVTFTVMVAGAASALTCQVTSAAPSCDMPGTLDLPARTEVGMRIVFSNNTPTGASWSWTFA